MENSTEQQCEKCGQKKGIVQSEDEKRMLQANHSHQPLPVQNRKNGISTKKATHI